MLETSRKLCKFVSIIIPVRNERDTIQSCLEAVLSQDYPKDQLEVIVADGMSDDGTRAIIQGYQKCAVFLKMIDNSGKIVPTGLNLALRQAVGEVIVRVDGHCVIAPDYLRRCVEHLQADGVDGVGGPITTVGETDTARAIAIGMSSRFGVGDSAFRTGIEEDQLADTVPFPAYTREIVERAGLYDEELVRDQDDEYNYRIRELGGKLLLSKDVCSTYFSRTNLGSLWKQYFQYGYWKVRVLQKHPRQMSARQYVPPLFVLSLAASGLSAFFWPSGIWVFAAIAGAYAAANLSASLITARKKGWRYLALLPWVYLSLHVGYGSGFLAGLAKFWNRWGDKKGLVPEWDSHEIMDRA